MRHLSSLFIFLAILLAKSAAHSGCGQACQTLTGPLPVDAVRVAAYGGFVPTYFLQKSSNHYLSNEGIGGFFAIGDSFNFHEQTRIPWTIGLDVGYVSTQYVELFMGMSYVKGIGKTHHFDVDGFHSKFSFKSYSDVGWWAGLRCHFIGADLCGQCFFDPFIGAKIGVKCYNKWKADYTAKELGFFQEDCAYYQRTWMPALGIQIGFTFNYFDCVDVVVMGEGIWAGPLRNNQKIFLGNGAGDIEAITVGHTGCLWSFPITVGLLLNL